MNQYLHQFATRLKHLREEKNMTLRALAEKTGISKSSLSNYENATDDPALSVVITLANYFDEDLSYLTGETSTRRLKKIAN